MIRNTLLAAAALAALAGTAHAGPLYWSLGAGVPGAVANWGPVVAPPPVVVAPPPPVVYYPRYAPAYGWGYPRWGYPPPWRRDDDRRDWRRWHHDDDDD